MPGVSDFGKINDFLYRGAQPKNGGVEQLKNLGVDTIVDLRGEFHGLIENERRRAESLGIRFINLPGSGWATAKDEEIAEFFSLIRERPRKKIFIHCWLGGDRSGMFIAAYRIAFEGVASAGDPGDAVIPLLTLLASEYGTLGRGIPRPPGSISQARILSPNTWSAIASAYSLESFARSPVVIGCSRRRPRPIGSSGD